MVAKTLLWISMCWVVYSLDVFRGVTHRHKQENILQFSTEYWVINTIDRNRSTRK